MDIMAPPLEEQVSPAPWLAVRYSPAVHEAIQECLDRPRKTTADEVVAELARLGIDANGTLVAQKLRQARKAGE
mgnify:CR=1 FL=1